MTEITPDALRAAAARAGIIDLDAVALADPEAPTAEAAIAKLKADKPHLFADARRMLEQEYRGALRNIEAGRLPSGERRPVPAKPVKHANEMTAAEWKQALFDVQAGRAPWSK